MEDLSLLLFIHRRVTIPDKLNLKNRLNNYVVAFLVSSPEMSDAMIYS